MREPKMVKMSVADAIGHSMKENGIEYFFYVMGGGSAGLREWEEQMGITTIMCRNEMAATNMADGCARVTKKPTVCFSKCTHTVHKECFKEYVENTNRNKLECGICRIKINYK